MLIILTGIQSDPMILSGNDGSGCPSVHRFPKRIVFVSRKCHLSTIHFHGQTCCWFRGGYNSTYFGVKYPQLPMYFTGHFWGQPIPWKSKTIKNFNPLDLLIVNPYQNNGLFPKDKILQMVFGPLTGIDCFRATLNRHSSSPTDRHGRCGTQGRAGQKGHAVTLIVERDAHALRGIVEAYGDPCWTDVR